MGFIAAAVGAVAGAIGSAVAAVGSFLGGLGIAGKLILGIGLNVASSLLQKAFAKKPKSIPGGVQLDRQYGENVPRQVACGLVGIAGHDCYVNTYAPSNKNLQQIYVLSDYYSDGFSRLAVNGEWVQIDRDNPHPERGWPITSGELNGYGWIKFYDGRQTTADFNLIDESNPVGRWTADHIGIGMTYVILTLVYDREDNNQFPDFFFEFRGAPLYDWRKDSTRGGVGSHRLNDPNTHEYSTNPIVMDYNYRIGFSVNNDRFCGMGMPISDLPLDKYTIAANICDEVVNGQPRYQCSIMLDAGPDTTHGDNIESLMRSCGGMVVDGVIGSWPIVGSAQPIVMTLTDNDLIPDQPLTYRAKQSMSQLINSISGNHPSPEQLWGMVGYKQQADAAAIVLDRRTRDLNIDFPQVMSVRQAEQLASIYLKENRLEKTAGLTARPRFLVLEPGDWIEWQSDMYGTDTFMIKEVSLRSISSDFPRCTQLSLQQRNGSIYDSVTPSIPVLPFPPGEPVYLNQLENFQVIPVAVNDPDGEGVLPAIRASWNAFEDETVVGIEIRYFPTDQPTSIFRKVVEPDVTAVTLVEGVVGNTEYTVQSRLICDPRANTPWTAGSVVVTMDIQPDLYPVDMNDLGDDVKGTMQQMFGSVRELIRKAEELDMWLADQDLGNAKDRQEIREQILAQYEESRAEYTRLVQVVADENFALAQRFEQLVAQIDNQVASAISLLQVQVDDLEGQVTAQAESLDQLTADVGTIAASVTMRGSARASPGGGWARWGVEVKVGSEPDVWSSAAFYLDTNGSLSREVHLVDQFIIANSAETVSVAPFLFTGTTAYLQNIKVQFADIENVQIGTAQIANGAITNRKVGGLQVDCY